MRHSSKYQRQKIKYRLQFSCSVMSDSATPWTAARQASLSITNSQSLPKLMSNVEKAMATHSSTLAWKIPGTGEPGGLPTMASHRVRHDWRDLAAAAPPPGPLNQWCHPVILSSTVPFSSCPQSFPASRSFHMSQLFAWGGQSVGFSASYQSFQWTPRTEHL